MRVSDVIMRRSNVGVEIRACFVGILGLDDGVQFMPTDKRHYWKHDAADASDRGRAEGIATSSTSSIATKTTMYSNTLAPTLREAGLL